ncbi:MAG: hypothetical protein C4560_06120 [Nitrospiraceae bacterium]|nr:MAG: hypothetical protein C4560_06120 [Nitrospiraceae bacterium]
MKKSILMLCALMLLGLSLIACQKKEQATEAPAQTETPAPTEQKPAESGEQKTETGGYGK